jgi:hypothetical protein
MATFVRPPQSKLVLTWHEAVIVVESGPETPGGRWRSSSAASGLSGRRMPRDVLSLFALRSRTTLLQLGVPQPGAAPLEALRQSPLPVESRGPARSSCPAQFLGRLEHWVKCVRIWLAVTATPHSQPHAIRRPNGRPCLAFGLLSGSFWAAARGLPARAMRVGSGHRRCPAGSGRR